MIILVMLTGIALRVLFYSYGRPFWNDESAMALNLVNRSFLGLFAPLDYSQLTPPLYSVFCKFFSLFIHKEEFAFRLSALVCSIAALPVFYLLSQKLLKNKISVIFANAVFALNYHIIYYAQELKQYSCDVLLFLAVLLSYFYIDVEKPLRLIMLSVFYAVCMWFSYTALFAMFVVFALLIVETLKNKNLKSRAFVKSRLKMFFSLFTLSAVSFGALYMLVKRFASDTVLHDFWADGFVSRNLSNLPKLVYNNMIFFFPDLNAKILLVVLFAAGFVFLLKNLRRFVFLKSSEKILSTQKALSFMLLMSMALAFFLSYFNIYPMYLRTALYLFGAVVLIMASSFEYGFFKKKSGVVISCLITICLVFTSLKTDYVQIIQKHYYRETTLDLLEAFKKNSQPQDKLIVPSLSSINYEYYGRFADIESKRVYYMRYPLYDYDDIKTAYDMLPSRSTYFVIVTHSGDKTYEKNNLLKYASTQKEPSAISDEFDNTLIRFKK